MGLLDYWTIPLCWGDASLSKCVSAPDALYKIKRKALCESHINPSVYALELAIKGIVRFP